MCGGGGGGGGKVQNIGGTKRGGVKIFSLAMNCRSPRPRPAPSQCQIIAFLTSKTDNIAKLRTELKNVLLEIPSNKIKGTYIKMVQL